MANELGEEHQDLAALLEGLPALLPLVSVEGCIRVRDVILPIMSEALDRQEASRARAAELKARRSSRDLIEFIKSSRHGEGGREREERTEFFLMCGNRKRVASSCVCWPRRGMQRSH